MPHCAVQKNKKKMKNVDLVHFADGPEKAGEASRGKTATRPSSESDRMSQPQKSIQVTSHSSFNKTNLCILKGFLKCGNFVHLKSLSEKLQPCAFKEYF